MLVKLASTHKGRGCVIIEVFCQGFKVGDRRLDHISGGRSKNIFHHDKNRSIDKIILSNLVLTRLGVQLLNVLFFFRLILAMFDVECKGMKSGVIPGRTPIEILIIYPTYMTFSCI